MIEAKREGVLGGGKVIHRISTRYPPTYQQGIVMWESTSSVLSVLSFILSIAACLFAARRVTRQPELQARWRSSTELRLSSLETSRDELSQNLADLANRVKMMRVRTTIAHPGKQGEIFPDPYKDPDGWRKQMNARIMRQKVGL